MAFLHRAAFFVCLAAFARQQAPPTTQPPPAQQPAPQTPAQPEKAVTEMATHDEQTTFKSRVDLVMIPVVVRDGKGKPVPGLKKEDFQLFDKGKPQTISRFSTEKAGGQSIKFSEDVDAKPAKDAESVIPQRFIAYLFDDIHASFANLAFARAAAIKHLSADLAPSDRAAIFTTSGQGEVDFTDDKATLLAAVNLLMPRPIGRSGVQECPDISYYMADLIVNKNNTQALSAATAETMACMSLDPSMASTAAQQAQMAAQTALGVGEHETQVTYAVLKDLIRRMSATPGQRIVVLASPGFFTTDTLRSDESDIMDRAIRNNITINSLDIRGLYVTGMDMSKTSYNSYATQMKDQYERESAMVEGDILGEISYGTGGTFFHNNNSMEEGFRATGTAPETYYLLGFSPQNLKLDGSFHALKVTLKTGHLEVQARKGYYAPKRLTDAAETAKQEIEEALFSREELRELPVDLHTQFFKAANGTATITVMAHLDVKHFKFKKADDRNNNTVTIVSSLFDRNGSMVVAITKKLELHLKDETLDKKIDTGLTIRTPFNVKPGTYLVRLVVRDTEGQMISAENSAVNAQ